MPGSDTPANGLAGDTHLAPGELIQRAKPTQSVTESFSPAELVFCRVRSQRDLTGAELGVQELVQRQCEVVAESSTEAIQHPLSLDLVILLLKCTVLILRRECKCS